jgi:hypothetical protein
MTWNSRTLDREVIKGFPSEIGFVPRQPWSDLSHATTWDKSILHRSSKKVLKSWDIRKLNSSDIQRQVRLLKYDERVVWDERGPDLWGLQAIAAFGVYSTYKGKTLKHFKLDSKLLWFLNSRDGWHSLMTTPTLPGPERLICLEQRAFSIPHWWNL